MNKDENFCEDLAKKLKVLVIRGDGSRRYVLEQLELNKTDLFVTLTPHDQDNLVSCLTAQRVFSIERPVALINDPDNREVFEKMGITTVISPTEILATAIEDSMFREQITNLLPTSDSVSILRIELNESSPVLGQKIMKIPLPHDSIVGAILRENEVVIPRGDTIVNDGDTLIELSSLKVKSAVFETLLGEV